MTYDTKSAAPPLKKNKTYNTCVDKNIASFQLKSNNSFVCSMADHHYDFDSHLEDVLSYMYYLDGDYSRLLLEEVSMKKREKLKPFY